VSDNRREGKRREAKKKRGLGNFQGLSFFQHSHGVIGVES
jgi:hypothetical protein